MRVLDPPLSSMSATASLPEEVRLVRDGHLLRWTKQMALRGRSREFDEEGVCGAQKLVLTGDLTLLMGNLQRVFPGAHVRSEDGPVKPERHKKLTSLHRLLRYLSTPGLPSRVDTEQIGDHFGRPWREFSGDLTRRSGIGAGKSLHTKRIGAASCVKLRCVEGFTMRRRRPLTYCG